MAAEHIRDWLKQLGVRISPSMRPEEFAGRISTLAEDLAETMPVEAFTRAAMLAVATRCRYWPHLAELHEFMQPFVAAAREGRHYAALPPPGKESREAYQLPPPPDWCYEREPRLMGRPREGELDIQKPIRSVAEQYAALNECSLEEAEAMLGLEKVTT